VTTETLREGKSQKKCHKQQNREIKRKRHVLVQISEGRTPVCAAARNVPYHQHPRSTCPVYARPPPESVVQLTIKGGAVISDVGAVLKSPGGCGEDCGGGEGEEGIGTPAGVCARVCACEDASDIARASVTVRVVVDPLVVSSDCTDCDRIDRDGGVSYFCCCCCREPCDLNE
jgi:hypothetical protein